MADKALPILFINLSGEMIYIIQQRLEAQKISPDKSIRVIQDIISAMLNDQFVLELFTPQNMYSRLAMQSVFEKLVHSSIMRLNTNSMEKLYDLMLMVFKYQVINCQDPEDIVFITLNHFDAIKYHANSCPGLKIKLESLHNLLIKNYKVLSSEEYESLFKCVVTFLQDLNIRVSVLMKLGLQSQTGEIIPMSLDENITENSKNISSSKARIGGMKKTPRPDSCYEFDGDRGTILGTNIYIISMPNSKNTPLVENASIIGDNVQAVDEINLLGRLIGRSNAADFIPDIFFPSEDTYEENCTNAHSRDTASNLCVNIDASKDPHAELGRISREFLIQEEIKEQSDILELLDIAHNCS